MALCPPTAGPASARATAAAAKITTVRRTGTSRLRRPRRRSSLHANLGPAARGPATRRRYTFRSLPSPVAQLAEHPAVNRRVVGSSPTRGARKPLQISTSGSSSIRVRRVTIGSAAGARPRDPRGARAIRAVLLEAATSTTRETWATCTARNAARLPALINADPHHPFVDDGLRRDQRNELAGLPASREPPSRVVPNR